VHVAFFRNLNQGQRGSPSTTQLVAAFERAGATGAMPFQSNGTVLFDAPGPDESANETIELLAAESPWRDVAFVRSAEWLLGLVTDLARDEPKLSRTELSLFDISVSPVDRLPLAGHRCTVVSGGPGYDITENDRDRESNATPTLQRALGLRVTSRGLPTLTRLVEQLSR
jgi:uncharacterized protein (DUF1697 family)